MVSLGILHSEMKEKMSSSPLQHIWTSSKIFAIKLTEYDINPLVFFLHKTVVTLNYLVFDYSLEIIMSC